MPDYLHEIITPVGTFYADADETPRAEDIAAKIDAGTPLYLAGSLAETVDDKFTTTIVRAPYVIRTRNGVDA